MGLVQGRATVKKAAQPFVNMSKIDVEDLFDYFNDISEGFALTQDELIEVFLAIQDTYFQHITKSEIVKDVRELFKLLDDDRNGLVDSFETFSFLAALSVMTLEDKLKFCFQMFDFDLDQSLNRDEFILCVRSLMFGILKTTDIIDHKGMKQFIPRNESHIELLAAAMFQRFDISIEENIGFRKCLSYCLVEPQLQSWTVYVNSLPDYCNIKMLKSNELNNLHEFEMEDFLLRYQAHARSGCDVGTCLSRSTTFRNELIYAILDFLRNLNAHKLFQKKNAFSSREVFQPSIALVLKLLSTLFSCFDSAQGIWGPFISTKASEGYESEKTSVITMRIERVLGIDVRNMIFFGKGLFYVPNWDEERVILYFVNNMIVQECVTTKKQQVHQIETEEISCVSVDYNNGTLAIGTKGLLPSVFVVELENFSLIKTYSDIFKGGITGLHITRNFVLGMDNKRTIALYDFVENLCLFIYNNLPKGSLRICIGLKDTSILPIVAGNGFITVYNVDGYNRPHNVAYNRITRSRTFSSLFFLNPLDSTQIHGLILGGTVSGHLYVIERFLSLKQVIKLHEESITTINFINNGKRILTSSLDGSLWILSYNLDKVKYIDLKQVGLLSTAITCCDINPIGMVVLATNANHLYELDIQEGIHQNARLVLNGPQLCSSNQPIFISINPSNEEYVVGCRPNLLIFYDIESHALLRKIELSNYPSSGFYFSEGSKLLVAFGQTSPDIGGGFVVLTNALKEVFTRKDSNSPVTCYWVNSFQDCIIFGTLSGELVHYQFKGQDDSDETFDRKVQFLGILSLFKESIKGLASSDDELLIVAHSNLDRIKIVNLNSFQQIKSSSVIFPDIVSDTLVPNRNLYHLLKEYADKPLLIGASSIFSKFTATMKVNDQFQLYGTKSGNFFFLDNDSLALTKTCICLQGEICQLYPCLARNCFFAIVGNLCSYSVYKVAFTIDNFLRKKTRFYPRKDIIILKASLSLHPPLFDYLVDHVALFVYGYIKTRSGLSPDSLTSIQQRLCSPFWQDFFSQYDNIKVPELPHKLILFEDTSLGTDVKPVIQPWLRSVATSFDDSSSQLEVVSNFVDFKLQQVNGFTLFKTCKALILNNGEVLYPLNTDIVLTKFALGQSSMVQRYFTAHDSKITAWNYFGEMDKVISASYSEPTGCKLVVWFSQTLDISFQFSWAKSKPVGFVDFFPCGKKVVLGNVCEDQEISVFSLISKTILFSVCVGYELLALSCCRGIILAATVISTFALNVETGYTLQNLSTEDPNEVTTCVIAKQNRMYLGSNQGKVSFYEVSEVGHVNLVGNQFLTRSMILDLTISRACLIVCDMDKRIRVLSLNLNLLAEVSVESIELPNFKSKHPFYCYSMDYDIDRSLLLCSLTSKDNSVLGCFYFNLDNVENCDAKDLNLSCTETRCILSTVSHHVPVSVCRAYEGYCFIVTESSLLILYNCMTDTVLASINLDIKPGITRISYSGKYLFLGYGVVDAIKQNSFTPGEVNLAFFSLFQLCPYEKYTALKTSSLAKSVGSGTIQVLDTKDLSKSKVNVLVSRKISDQPIVSLAETLNNKLLAVGSMDNRVYLLNQEKDFTLEGTVNLGSAFAIAIDLSKCNQYARVNTNTKELYFFNVKTTGMASVTDVRNIRFSTKKCLFSKSYLSIHQETLDSASMLSRQNFINVKSKNSAYTKVWHLENSTSRISVILDSLGGLVIPNNALAAQQERKFSLDNCMGLSEVKLGFYMPQGAYFVLIRKHGEFCIYKYQERNIDLMLCIKRKNMEPSYKNYSTIWQTLCHNCSNRLVAGVKPWYKSIVPPTETESSIDNSSALICSLQATRVFGCRITPRSSFFKYCQVKNSIIYSSGSRVIEQPRHSKDQKIFKATQNITCLSCCKTSGFFIFGTEKNYFEQDKGVTYCSINIIFPNRNHGQYIDHIPGDKIIHLDIIGNQFGAVVEHSSSAKFVVKYYSLSRNSFVCIGDRLISLPNITVFRMLTSSTSVLAGDRYIFEINGVNPTEIYLSPPTLPENLKGLRNYICSSSCFSGNFLLGSSDGILTAMTYGTGIDFEREVSISEEPILFVEHYFESDRLQYIVGTSSSVLQLSSKLKKLTNIDLTFIEKTLDSPNKLQFISFDILFHDLTDTVILCAVEDGSVLELEPHLREYRTITRGWSCGSILNMMITKKSTLITAVDTGLVTEHCLKSHTMLRSTTLSPLSCMNTEENESYVAASTGDSLFSHHEDVESGVIIIMNHEFVILTELRNAKMPFCCLLFSKEGNLLAGGNTDGMIYIYNVQQEFKLHSRLSGHKHPVRYLDFSHDSSYLRSICEGCELLYFSCENRVQIKSPSLMKDLMFCTSNCIFTYNTQGIWPELEEVYYKVTTTRLFQYNEKQYLAVGDNMGFLKIYAYPVITREVKPLINVFCHSSSIIEIAVSDNGEIYTTGCLDKTICEWTIEISQS